MFKRFLAILIVFSVILTGCSAQEQEEPSPSPSSAATTAPSPVPTPSPTPTPTPEPEPEISLEGLDINPLTGLYIDEDIVPLRPYAVVINNLPKSLPQSGISQADIIYEVLAEGGVTRLVALFKDFDSGKIGSIRSTRPYFLDFAMDNDAIFVHHGGSEQGYSDIYKYKYDHLDGMRLDGKTFIRDQQRLNTPGMYEHSSFTAADLLVAQANAEDMRTALKDEYETPFDFFTDDKLPAGEEALNITVPYAPQSQVGYFEYDPENQVYLRYQNGNPHMDSEVDEQLTVSNILVQKVKMGVIDSVGRRDVTLTGQGDGFYITKGHIYPVSWERGSRADSTKWFDAQGEKLKISPGKSWICILQNQTDLIIEN